MFDIKRFFHLTLIIISPCLALAQSNAPTGGDLMSVSPVTDKILMLHIRDGHIITYGLNERPENNITFHDPTDIDRAMDASIYSLFSDDDPNYYSGRNPVHTGRKSKGWEYQNIRQNPPYIMQHWIYLEFQQALVQGRSYTLTLNNITGNTDSFAFTFDVNRIRSETVRVNMVGFPEQGPKVAYLSHWMGDFHTSIHSNGGLNLDNKAGATCRVLDYESRETVYATTITKRMSRTDRETASDDFPSGNYTNADVWECDFSAYVTPGEYVVAVDGIGHSFPFEIGNDVTREAFYYAMKGLFWQRQGIAVEVEPDSIRPRGQHPDDIVWRFDEKWVVDSAYDDSGFNRNSPRIREIWGHYYDAGDWDGYTHHNRVPAHLLLLYDLAPEGFHDGDVGNRYKLEEGGEWIDEGRSGKPDLLDEAAWLPEFNRRARHALKEYGATGGVPGFVGRDAIPYGNTITAWEDTREWFLSGENLQATYFHAANSAYYAINLNQYHRLQGGSSNHSDYDEWMTEALESWEWADNKADELGAPQIDENAEKRARGYAAAALYRATGETSYQTIFEEYWTWEPSKGSGEWAGVNLHEVAATLYALIPPGHAGLNAALQEECRNYIIQKADTKVGEFLMNGFRNSMYYLQFLQLGGFTTPRVTALGAAHRLTGNREYLETMQHAVNYVMGGNQMNMAYLSGLGERSDQWIFQPNAYLVSNKNSKVYTPENYIGQTSYFGATGLHSGYWHGTGTWKWSEYFSRMAAYPQAADPPSVWPGAEQKFQNRYSIQGAEFTIHQQMNHMIFAMGYINAMANKSQTPYSLAPRPRVSLKLSDGQTLDDTGCTFSVEASANTRRIEYYAGWRFIGESDDSENGFKIHWSPINSFIGLEQLITAVAYSDRGRRSLPSDAGEVRIRIPLDTQCIHRDEDSTGEVRFHLYQNYPNPFRLSTFIQFDLPYYSPVAITIYDMLGRKLEAVLDEPKPQGKYTIEFDGSRLASGVYIYKMHTVDYAKSLKMTLVR